MGSGPDLFWFLLRATHPQTTLRRSIFVSIFSFLLARTVSALNLVFAFFCFFPDLLPVSFPPPAVPDLCAPPDWEGVIIWLALYSVFILFFPSFSYSCGLFYSEFNGFSTAEGSDLIPKHFVSHVPKFISGSPRTTIFHLVGNKYCCKCI